MAIAPHDGSRSGGPSAVLHRVRAMVEYLERNRELPPRLRSPGAEPAGDPGLARLALERLRRDHDDLLVAEKELRALLDLHLSAEHSAAAERAQAHELFNLLPDPLLVTDEAGVVREANAAAAQMLLISAVHLRGRALSALVDAEHREEFLGLVAQRGDEEVTAVVGMHGRRGARARVRLRGVPMSGGRRTLWSARDEAPEGGEVEALRQRLRELEAGVERERLAREATEARLRARDRALGLLAHEMRGPLSIIGGWAKMLLADASDAAQRGRALAAIERQASAQTLLVQDLLDAAALDAGAVRLRFERVDLGALARECVEAVEPVAEAAGLRVSCDALDGLAALGDLERLRQVLTSLLSHAVRSVPRGGRVEVRAAAVDEAWVELAVEDDGRGLSSAAQRDAFGFFPTFEDGTRHPKGTNLGLHLAERLVALHGGAVSVESEGEGRGARYRVRLPAVSPG